MKDQHAQIEKLLRELAQERGLEMTFCPSEVARKLDRTGWRQRMPAIRAVAAELVQAGVLRCTQRGVDVDPTGAHGPIRLRLSS